MTPLLSPAFVAWEAAYDQCKALARKRPDVRELVGFWPVLTFSERVRVVAEVKGERW